MQLYLVAHDSKLIRLLCEGKMRGPLKRRTPFQILLLLLPFKMKVMPLQVALEDTKEVWASQLKLGMRLQPAFV